MDVYETVGHLHIMGELTAQEAAALFVALEITRRHIEEFKKESALCYPNEPDLWRMIRD